MVRTSDNLDRGRPIRGKYGQVMIKEHCQNDSYGYRTVGGRGGGKDSFGTEYRLNNYQGTSAGHLTTSKIVQGCRNPLNFISRLNVMELLCHFSIEGSEVSHQNFKLFITSWPYIRT